MNGLCKYCFAQSVDDIQRILNAETRENSCLGENGYEIAKRDWNAWKNRGDKEIIEQMNRYIYASDGRDCKCKMFGDKTEMEFMLLPPSDRWVDWFCARYDNGDIKLDLAYGNFAGSKYICNKHIRSRLSDHISKKRMAMELRNIQYTMDSDKMYSENLKNKIDDLEARLDCSEKSNEKLNNEIRDLQITIEYSKKLNAKILNIILMIIGFVISYNLVYSIFGLDSEYELDNVGYLDYDIRN